MSLFIFYTPRSEDALSSVYNFIQNKFGVKPAEKFAEKTEKTISLIAKHPFIFKASTMMKMSGLV